MNNFDQTLTERGVRYGNFQDVASRTTRIYHHMVYQASQLASNADLLIY